MASLNDIETKIQSIIDRLSIKTITGTLPLTFTAKGGTAADWVIEGNAQGVGERTKNHVDITGFNSMLYGVRWYEDNGRLKASGTYTDNAAHTQPRFYVKLNAGTYTMSGSPNFAQSGVYLQVGTCTDERGSNFSSLGSDTGTGYTFMLQEGSWVGIRVVTATSLYQQTVDLILPLMLRLADTTPEFIPHGYQIPITVSQQGQPDKTVGIYIGADPLTEGETVSKASTGVDIELFEGENVISTTLYNKPTMKITYNGGN